MRLREAGIGEVLGVGGAGGVFAVDDEEFLHVLGFLAGEIADEFVVVAVAGERLDGGEGGFHLEFHAEDGDLLVAAHNLGAEGGGGAVADRQDGGARVLDVVGEVVFHAPRLHHAGGRDDDAGTVVGVEPFRVLDAADVVQVLESERVGVGLDVFLQFLGEAVAVEAEDVGGGDGQRAVHEDFDIGEVALVLQFLEGIDDFLCAADGEGGDDEFPLSFGAGVADDEGEVGFGLVEGGVQAVAVG